jgi:AraC-like DNA-binding protein
MPGGLNGKRDVIERVLDGARVEGALFVRAAMRTPWGFAWQPEGPSFHIVVDGRCAFQPAGAAPPTMLGTGDFIVLPRALAHTLRDPKGHPALELPEFMRRHPFKADGSVELPGEGRPTTTVVCGQLRITGGGVSALLRALPEVLRVPAIGDGPVPWLKALLTLADAESAAVREGRDAMLCRLSEILFVQAVRAFVAETAVDAGGWLGAVRDGRLGAALDELHADPARAWTVGELARKSALSRSAFAARFTEAVGETPVRYLARLRLDLAGERLRRGDEKIGAIAAAAGYDSVAAFTRAFKRQWGQTPGDYRRR